MTIQNRSKDVPTTRKEAELTEADFCAEPTSWTLPNVYHNSMFNLR